ncbi:hypothetical protein LTR66_009225 [Elasticomyces elasticus]|nr:hypothetical protein LTR66_009225 [Elasticomyces elasticus]
MAQYGAPEGPPPKYPQQPPQAHYDAGPANASYYNGGDPRAQQGYYGSPAPQQYGSPAPFNQGPYGPPQQQYQQGPGPYGGPQQGMQYQQQGPYGAQPGYQNGGRGGRYSGSEGICAGIAGALACCCCLDCLF